MISRMKLEGAGVAPVPDSSFGMVMESRSSRPKRGQHLQSPVDPLERCFPPQNLQRFKQRRRDLAAADRDANRLEHLPWLNLHLGGGRPQRRVQCLVPELRCLQN